MKFYAYKQDVGLGKEPLGTDGRMLFELKTVAGAIRRCRSYGYSRLFSYSNFYDDGTFKEIEGVR